MVLANYKKLHYGKLFKKLSSEFMCKVEYICLFTHFQHHFINFR